MQPGKLTIYLIALLLSQLGCRQANQFNLAELNSLKVYHDLDAALLDKDSVERLDISNHSVYTAFPEEIRQLKNLKVLIIRGNECASFVPDYCKHITEIPAWVKELKHLELMSLPANYIQQIPDELLLLPKLKGLSLTDNRRIDLSNTNALSNLEYLYINGAQLNSLPESMCLLTNLKELGLHGNMLDSAEAARIQHCLPNCKVSIGTQYPAYK